MNETVNLKLPYIMAAQAQKHVTHNEAIQTLDALVQISVIDRDLTVPPGTPNSGDRYIPASGATGDWAGKDGQIAAFQDNAWVFHQPREGWLVWIEDEGILLIWRGSNWSPVSEEIMNPTSLVGVNTTADATNRLSVSSPNSLFTHEGAGHQLKVNKNTSGDTSSVLFQTNYSGRAEFGTTGDDDFHVKVSPDGSTWRDAILIDKDTGEVSLPSTTPDAPTISSLFPAKRKIMAGAEDVTFLFIGDSSSDETSEWIYRFAEFLGEEYPTHTVLFYQHDGTAYGAASTLSTGTGARTIHVYNASVGGYHISHWMTTRYGDAIGALTPDVIITNDGVNRWSSSVADIRRYYIQAFQQILLDKPGTPIAIMLQYPFRDDDGMDSVIEGLRCIAEHFPGMTVMDAHSRFVEAGKPSAWYTNNTHPNSAGSTVILDEAKRHWNSARDLPPCSTFGSWLTDRATVNLIPNGDLSAFDNVVPDRWIATDESAVAKETTTVFPGKPHSVKITGGNNLLKFTFENDAIKPLLGKKMSLAVRLYATSGGHSGTGKFWVAIDGDATGHFSIDTGTWMTDGWLWQVIDDIRVPTTANRMEVVLASSGAVSVAGTAYFDEAVLYQGEGRPNYAGDVHSDLITTPSIFNLLKDGGRFAENPEAQGTGIGAFSAPSYLKSVNGSTFAAGPKFIFNNNDYGGTNGTLDPDVKSLIDKLKDDTNLSYRRYGPEFYLMQVTAGSGTSTSVTIDGTTYYLVLTNPSVPVPDKLTFNFHVLVKSGALGLMYDSDLHRQSYLDGIAFKSHQVIAPADGWKQVTRLLDVEPRKFSGYTNIIKRLYALPGTVFYIAIPTVTPGHLPVEPGLYYGVTPSLETWR